MEIAAVSDVSSNIVDDLFKAVKLLLNVAAPPRRLCVWFCEGVGDIDAVVFIDDKSAILDTVDAGDVDDLITFEGLLKEELFIG